MPAATAINMVSTFFSRPYAGERKFQLLVINRVRVLANGMSVPPVTRPGGDEQTWNGCYCSIRHFEISF